MAPPKKPKFGRVRRGIIVDSERGYDYYVNSASSVSYHLLCKYKGCFGRAIQSIKTEVIQQTKDHSCNVTPARRAKDAAIERLKELTLSVEGSVKAIELVRKVLKEITPEVRALMPSEESLIHRVRRWARSSNIQLVKATPEDYLIPEGEEPLEGFAGIAVSADRDASSSTSILVEAYMDNNTSSNNGVTTKTGVVYTEPVAGLAECEEKKPSGLIYLENLLNDHHKAVIEGQSYFWRQNLNDGKLLYVCEKSVMGCPVTVIIDNNQKRYELKGTHFHSKKNKSSSSKRHHSARSLKRIDENGEEIGAATLGDFLSGPSEWQNFIGEEGQSQHYCSTTLTPNPETSVFTNVENDAGIMNDDDYIDHDGDDFPVDSEFESIPVQPTLIPKLKTHDSSVIITSSKPPVKTSLNKTLPKHVVKSGERCFVCGDELIVSETLAASQETFRKACRYLNVKSEGRWFPPTENYKFYSFCEFCTTEITRIHSLYKKVEEIQSLIFKKVESVEKRIADAEIVDNWMAEAPHATVARFEGFRKQVMLNYRNKLKLRRQIRFGKKTGQPLIEIQPSPSAHMFAKDPSTTDAFNVIDSDSVLPEENKKNSAGPNLSEPSVVPVVKRRTRGRPKSKKPPDEREDFPVPLFMSQSDPLTLEDHNSTAAPDIEDDCFEHDFDDSQDAISVTSEKEIKFWEDDPRKLKVGRPVRKQTVENTFDDYENDMAEENDSDPDYQEEDVDWVPTKRKKRQKLSKSLKTTTPETEASEGWPSRQAQVPQGPRKIIFEDSRQRKKKKTEPKKPKTVKASHSNNIKFPDAVLTKDGRVFMEGIEIIKNPPGSYKPRPYSVSYSCGVCGRMFTGFWKVREHICGQHLGMFKCPVCHKEFADGKMVQRHVQNTHEKPVFEACPICQKPIKIYANNSMRQHRWSHLSVEEKQDPQYRTWRYQNPKDKDAPQASKRTPRQQYMCVQCGFVCKVHSALKRHELTHDPEYDTELMCQYCGKTFSKRKGLTQHVYNCSRKSQGIVNNLKTYPCPKCPTRFSSRATRSKHVRRFHSNVTNTELPFSCQKCPRSFSSRTGFRLHKRVCVEGAKGYNSDNKRTLDPKPSTSSTSSDIKVYKTDSRSTTMEQNEARSFVGSNYSQSSNEQSSSAAALGFSYNFMGQSRRYGDSQYQ